MAKAASESASASTISGEKEDAWKIELINSSLWEEFGLIGTEMVITKSGR